MQSDYLIKCAACGSDDFLKPAKVQSDTQITCHGCGRRSTWGELQQAALDQAKKLVNQNLSKGLRKR